MNKKAYEAPVVRKVRLVLQEAILGHCNTSTNNYAGDLINCYITECEILW
jgi:hypothetical protein